MATVRKRKWTHNGQEKEAWVVTYTDEVGKRRQKTFDKKKDADRYRAHAEVEVERGEHVPAREALTVKELSELFLAHLEDRLRQKTIGRAYRWHLASIG